MKRKPKKQKDPSYLPGSHVKLSFKKHVLPPLLGLLVGITTLGLLNTQVIIGKISEWTYKPPATVAADDRSTGSAKPDPNAPSQIIINSIKVKAPVIYDQKTVDEGAFQIALRDGVVHYPKTAVPGKKGNIVIFGHSSGQVWAPGKYKFVFTHLDRLVAGNKIFLDYQGTRYTYTVRSKKVVPPTDISVLNPTEKNSLTLITCTPVGTSKDRLIILAEQTAPVPDAKLPDESSTRSEIEELPGTVNPSLWDSIREFFN